MPPVERGWIRRLATSRALWALVVLSAGGYVLMHLDGGYEAPGFLYEQYGFWAPVLTVPLHALIAVTPLPSDVFGIFNGTLYGFWFGVGFNWAAWFGASFVQYAIGRRAGVDFQVDTLLERAPGWLRRFPVDHPAFLIGARFLPYVGGHLATLVPGAFGISLFRFSWCSALAILPQSLVTAGIGAGLWLL